MKRFGQFLALLALVALAGLGCKKDEPAPAAGGEKEEAAAAEKAAPGEEPAAEKKAKEAAAEKKAEEAAAAKKAEEPAPAKKAAAAAPAGEGPEHALLAHLEKATEILEKHQDDPDAAAKAINAYAAENKADLERIKKELEALEKSMTEEQKKAKGMELMQTMGPLMQRMMKVMGPDSKLAQHEGVQNAMKELFPQ